MDESLVGFVFVSKIIFGNYFAFIFCVFKHFKREYYNNYTGTRRGEIPFRRDANLYISLKIRPRYHKDTGAPNLLLLKLNIVQRFDRLFIIHFKF